MDKISELKRILGQQLGWHKSRLDCFAQMLLSLLAVKTVNLHELAIGMNSQTQISSRNKRVYRFFASFTIDMTVISRWLFQLFFSSIPKVYVAIDRTNWYWGRQMINIFMLSVCFEGIAIPILWTVDNKKGTSSAVEQIALCERFVKLFGSECIEGLLGDREFANKTFIAWLCESKIPFYLRIKGDTHTHIKKQKFQKVSALFSPLKPYEQQVFGIKVRVLGQSLYLSASKNERGELMIIATNAKYASAVAIYLRRWEIESLFQAFKGRGFRFEDTHVTHPERIEKIIVLLAVGFAWAHKTGEWQAEKKPISFKKFKTQRRPQYSFFRYGLDHLRDLLTNLTTRQFPLKRYLKLLEIPRPEVAT